MFISHLSHLYRFPSIDAPHVAALGNHLSFFNLKHFHFPTTAIKPYSQFSTSFCSPISSSPVKFAPNATADDDRKFESYGGSDFVQALNQSVLLLRSILPDGTWWDLRHYCVAEIGRQGKSISVISAIGRIWALIADDRLVVFAAFVSLTIAALSEISMPNLLAACIFSAQNGESMVFYKNSQLLMLLCLTSGVCSGLRGCCFGIANMTLMKRLRETLYSVVLFQDISYFDTEAVGNLTSRLGSDCQRLSRVIGNDLHLIFRNLLQGSGALINLLLLSQPLALSSLAICLVLSAIYLIYGPYQKEAARVTHELEACANEVAHEAYSLVRTIRVYGTEEEEAVRYKNCLNKLTCVNMRESVASGLWSLSFNALYRSTQIFAVLFGGMSIFAGHLSPEQITKYILYCEWLIYATWRLVDSCTSLLQSVGASETLFRLMDLLPSNQFLSKGVKLRQLRGNIEFVNVSFIYPTRVQTLVLKHVSMSIGANEVVAVVGPSGSGKSTLVKLLLRFFETTEGETPDLLGEMGPRLVDPMGKDLKTAGQILVDGLPLKDLDIRWLREGIGYVGQEPHLFHMDVKSNITYGLHRHIAWEDVECAAKLAYAHDFIQSLPQGYNTLVDDGLLSGGQKQRIAIARAILRNPAILILDEPTSALDAESEHYITEVLHALRTDCKTRTIILIAHRLSTVKTADRIFVMDSGHIVEMGSHEELLQKTGYYARLFRLQE